MKQAKEARQDELAIREKIAWEVLYKMVTVDHARVDIADMIYEYADQILSLIVSSGGGVCPACAGTGKSYHKAFDCPRCNGTGQKQTKTLGEIIEERRE